LRRLFTALFTAGGALILVSVFLNLVPGDPVDVMLGEQASAVDREGLRHAVGLDLPWYGQLWRFVQQFFTGKLHTSLPPFQKEVVPQILAALPNTLVLALTATAIAVALAVPLGVAASARPKGLVDHAAMGAAVLGAALPRFWLGPMLIIAFALKLDWLPVSGAGSIKHLLLPALTLGTALACLLCRVTRAAMLDELGQNYVTVAKAKGLSFARILWKHALPNALLPVLTLLGLEFGALLGGAIVTEKVFAWPGMGTLLLNGIVRRDYNLVRAVVLVFTLSYVAVNALTDWAYTRVDPRVRER
jgi:peptide/nickel transport system permease protein